MGGRTEAGLTSETAARNRYRLPLFGAGGSLCSGRGTLQGLSTDQNFAGRLLLLLPAL